MSYPLNSTPRSGYGETDTTAALTTDADSNHFRVMFTKFFSSLKMIRDAYPTKSILHPFTYTHEFPFIGADRPDTWVHVNEIAVALNKQGWFCCTTGYVLKVSSGPMISDCNLVDEFNWESTLLELALANLAE